MLTIGLCCPACPPHSIVEAAQLALGAAVHIPEAAHDGVRLIVEIEAIGHQLVQVNFW
jgi:hypothetical protein